MMISELITRLQYELEVGGDKQAVLEVRVENDGYQMCEVAKVSSRAGIVERVDYVKEYMDYVLIDI